jgi:GNAT superfamily N-acetyltransferase
MGSIMTEQHETDIIRRGTDEILFRRLDAPVASWTKAGGRWAVEYWCAEMAYPIAQAWVFTGGYEPYVDWLYVMEEHRRAGIGAALLDAIRARWPGVEFDAFTESGNQFLAAYGETSDAE